MWGGWGQSYDMWSVVVIFLELILGTSRVLQIESRTRAVIDQVQLDTPCRISLEHFTLLLRCKSVIDALKHLSLFI